MRAVEGFDPSMNTRFSTYASYWIKQSIMRSLINTGKTIRVPEYMNKQLVKWRRATAKLQDKLDRNPTNEEIAASLKLSMKQLNIIKRAIRIYNASPQAHPRQEGMSIDETLMDDNALTPETNVLMQDDLQQVMDRLSKMDKREGAVLRLRFGLGGEEPKTLREIGEWLGLTRERVRQIENEALCKLSECVWAG
jgi:RNA polymerase primary sigma factor